jgi:hypothetical protein
VILTKFWSRYDLQNFRKRKFLGDDQGELSKGTVPIYSCRSASLPRIPVPIRNLERTLCYLTVRIVEVRHGLLEIQVRMTPRRTRLGEVLFCGACYIQRYSIDNAHAIPTLFRIYIHAWVFDPCSPNLETGLSS